MQAPASPRLLSTYKLQCCRVPRGSAHLNVERKMAERLYSNNETAQSRYVEMEEKEIIYGDPTSQNWTDVEADAIDLEKEDLQIEGNHPVIWEQWAGLVENGQNL